MPKIADLLGIVGSTFTIGSRSLTAGLRRIAVRSGSFLGAIDWTITANRTITLPNDTVTLLGDDRPIGTLNAGVSVRGYEPIITVTATKTLALADSGTVQNCTNAAAAVITIPLNSAVAFPIGTRIIIRKTTAQTVTIAQEAGVTVLNSLGTALTITGVTSATTLRKTGTDAWIAFPDLPETAIGGALRTAVDASSAKSTIGLSLVTNVLVAEPRASGIQIGTGSALSNTTSTSWAAIGIDAARSNTSGIEWTAIGFNAARNNTIGTFWTAIGSNAALASTTGSEWIAIGTYAGAASTTGGAWAAIGNAAGAANISGTDWVAVGNRAGRLNTGGSFWTAIGSFAAFSSTTSSDWTAIGYNAATANTTGASWTAIGANAALASTTGTQWIAIGAYAGAGNTTGNFWTAIGNIAGAANVSGSNWVAIGHNAARFSTGSNWVMIGPNAGFDVTSGASNTIIGADTGRGITTGGGNTIIGAGVVGLAAALVNTVIIASGDGIAKIFSDSTGLKVGVNSSDSRLKLTSPNGTIHTFAVNDSGVLFKV